MPVSDDKTTSGGKSGSRTTAGQAKSKGSGTGKRRARRSAPAKKPVTIDGTAKAAVATPKTGAAAPNATAAPKATDAAKATDTAKATTTDKATDAPKASVADKPETGKPKAIKPVAAKTGAKSSSSQTTASSTTDRSVASGSVPKVATTDKTSASAKPVSTSTAEPAKNSAAQKSSGTKQVISKPQDKSGAGFGSLLAAGLTGAVLALIGLWALLSAGLIAGDERETALNERLAALETQIEGVVARPEPATPGLDAAAVEAAIDTRLAALPANAADGDSAAALEAVGAIEGSVGTLSSDVEAVRARLSAIDTALEGGAGGEQAALDAVRGRVDALATRLTALSATVGALGAVDEAALQERLSPVSNQAGENSAQLGDLSTRLNETRQALSAQIKDATTALDAVVATNEAQKTALNEQASALETVRSDIEMANSQQGEQLTGLKGAQDETAAAVSALNTRVEELAVDVNDDAPERRAALALAAANLKARVDAGEGYATELALAREIDPELPLADLEPYAADGIANRAALAERFEPVADAILTATASEPEGRLGGLFASARSVVQVRGTDGEGATTPNAVVADIRGALQRGDLAAVPPLWETLPAEGQDAGKDWFATLQARLTAERVVPDTLNNLMKQAG